MKLFYYFFPTIHSFDIFVFSCNLLLNIEGYMVRKYKGRKYFGLTMVLGSLLIVSGSVYMLRDYIQLEIADIAITSKGKMTTVITPADAKYWYNLAAENGNLEAQAKLGNLLTNPKNSLVTQKEGVKWLTRSADSGDFEAMYSLGLLYSKGAVIEANKDLALKYLIKSADNQETVTNHPVIYSKIASLYYSKCLETSPCSINNENLKNTITWAEKGVANNEIQSAEILTDIYISNKTGLTEVEALKKAQEFNSRAIALGSHTNGMAVLISLKLYEVTKDPMYINDYNKHFPFAYVDPQDKQRTMLENAPILSNKQTTK